MNILDIHQRQHPYFNAINYSTAMNQLTKIRTVNRHHPALEMLMETLRTHLLEHQGEWTIRVQVTVLHAIAKMRVDFPAAQEVANLILQNAALIVEDGSPISVSLTAWSVATMNLDCPLLFTSIDQHASHLVMNGNTQCISNTAWACAKSRAACTMYFRAVDQEAERLVADGVLQAISITMWAFASLQIECPKLIKAFGVKAEKMATEGSPQNVANTAWAFATMGIDCPVLFQAIQRNPDCVITDGHPQAISNTAWAFATLKCGGTSFWRAVDDRASHLVTNGTAQDIANTLWAFASQRLQAPSLCRLIEDHADAILSRGDIQHISNIVWSFATLGVACPNLCRAVDGAACRLIRSGSSQSVANILWGMSTLGFEASSLFEALGPTELDDLVKACNSQELVNICFAFAISGAITRHVDSFTKVWKEAIAIDWKQLPNQGRVQLVHSYLIATQVHPGMEFPAPKWSSEVLTIDTHESRAQQEMSEILKEIGFDHEMEVSPFALHDALDLWMIDCACRDRKIAIEFDGPSHFLRSAQSRRLADIENGPTKAKRRFLKGLGWTVINISYLDWTEAATRERKQDLLASRLISIG